MKGWTTAAAAAGLVALVAGLALLGRTRRPAGADAAPRRVRVAAAADLRFALEELSARFAAERGIAVRASYGSSGTFYAQLLNRAPFDLYLSADVNYPRQLAARNLTVPGTEFTYAIGRLVAWAPAASPIADRLAGGLSALTDPSVRHIAIANPAHAPYGRAAVAALQHAGMYDAVQSKLVFGENVEQAFQFAQSGAADVGLIARSLTTAPAAAGAGRSIDVPPDWYPRITQTGVILKTAADLDAVRAFCAFMTADEGRAILATYGFAGPER